MLDNPAVVKNDIVNWIKRYFAENGDGCSAVVGISGGKDSSVVAALCVEALGKDRVIPVLMPDGEQADIEDSWRIVDHLGLRDRAVLADIDQITQAFYDTLCDSIGGISAQATVNIPPRVRMTTLYAIAQTYPIGGGRVANTCNMSEDFIGYSTKYGDSAGDFAPIADFVVSEIKQLGYELGLPEDLIEKTPSDGLCGKSDEENLGFTYDQVEAYIGAGTCGDSVADKMIATRHNANLHKIKRMPRFYMPQTTDYSEWTEEMKLAFQLHMENRV